MAAQGDRLTVRENDFVELARLPGEEYTRVACVEALWEDLGGQMGQQQLGTFRIFYRAEVCLHPYSPMQMCSCLCIPTNYPVMAPTGDLLAQEPGYNHEKRAQTLQNLHLAAGMI